MKMFWQRNRNDIVAVCAITGTVIAVLTFFGFAPKDQPQLDQSAPLIERPVEGKILNN